jgi:hypothetical protein
MPPSNSRLQCTAALSSLPSETSPTSCMDRVDAETLKATYAAERTAFKSFEIARMQLQLGAIGYLGLLQAENTCDAALLASFRRRRRGTPRRPRCFRRSAAAGTTTPMRRSLRRGILSSCHDRSAPPVGPYEQVQSNGRIVALTSTRADQLLNAAEKFPGAPWLSQQRTWRRIVGASFTRKSRDVNDFNVAAHLHCATCKLPSVNPGHADVGDYES